MPLDSQSMKTILAIVAVLFGLVPLGFIVTAAIEAVISWGWQEAIEEFTFPPNAVVATACVVSGAFFVFLGARTLRNTLQPGRQS